MEFLRKLATQTRTHLSGLSVSQRLVLALCAVVIVGSLVWLFQWSGRSALVPLIDAPMTPDERQAVQQKLATGNWKGATTGWLLTRETLPMMIRGVPQTLPGLERFYMAGHWVEPGGTVTMAAASGKNAIRLICAEDGVDFTTTI